MFDPAVTITIICLYMGLLFCVASWAERRASTGRSVARNPAVYSASLAIYCTAWTYYGSVGKAATSGWIFLTIYLGPTLGIFLWWVVLRKMVRIKNKYHVTSLADFVSARYGKSQTLAIMVTLIALIGITPYIALQLKAVTSTFFLITAKSEKFWLKEYMGLLVVVLMSLFAIIFGARRLDASERHEGMVVALSVECVIKLAIFLAVGLFVTFVLFNGFGDIFQRFSQTVAFRGLEIGKSLSNPEWPTYLALSMFGVLFLPRQFHIAVVENSDERHILKAMWMFPLYLLLINLFVMPIAMGGLLKGGTGMKADFFVLSLPLHYGGPWLAMAAFIGGFSAATGMIIVSSMTLATMVTNHLLLPVLERTRKLRFLRKHLLKCRWAAIAAIIMLGHWFESCVGESYMLVNMGILAFAAVFQFAPAIVGGIFWPRGNKQGAILGMSAGFAVWSYTLLVPTFVKSGWLSEALLRNGPLGIGFLRPERLFGISGMTPLNHGVFWSMVFNVGLYMAGSLYFAASEEEQGMAKEFMEDMSVSSHTPLSTYGEAHIDLGARRKQVEQVLVQYLSDSEAGAAIDQCLEATGIRAKTLVSMAELMEFLKEIEARLAGSIGASSAHRALRQGVVLDMREEAELTGLYTRILQDLQLGPTELRRKIDYYKERQTLLSDHFSKLEARVEERTSELVASNLQLKTEIDERTKAERSLRESEQRFRSLFEHHRAIMLLVDPKSFEIRDANPAAAEFYGYAREELRAMKITELNQLSAEQAAAVSRGIETGEQTRFVFPHRLRDGQIRTVEVHSSSITVEGRTVNFSIIHDLTEQKILESQLAQAQKLESIGQLAAGIAHEINTPAQFVGDNTRFLRDACADMERVFALQDQLLGRLKERKQVEELAGKIEEVCTEIDSQYLREEIPKAFAQSLDGLQRISGIVGAMKEFSHPGTDSKVCVDLNRALQSTITVSRNEWKYVAEMVTDLDPALPPVPCLPGEINQVFLNLIMNASQAIAEAAKGNGAQHKGTITITTRTLDQYARISITDTGCGIPENIRSRIFDPFFTTKDVGKGTGQGLAISHSVVVDKHGGTITVDSEVGRGAVFVVRLPLDSPGDK